jgi:hypothetical protein
MNLGGPDLPWVRAVSAQFVQRSSDHRFADGALATARLADCTGGIGLPPKSTLIWRRLAAAAEYRGTGTGAGRFGADTDALSRDALLASTTQAAVAAVKNGSLNRSCYCRSIRSPRRHNGLIVAGMVRWATPRAR